MHEEIYSVFHSNEVQATRSLATKRNKLHKKYFSVSIVVEYFVAFGRVAFALFRFLVKKKKKYFYTFITFTVKESV